MTDNACRSWCIRESCHDTCAVWRGLAGVKGQPLIVLTEKRDASRALWIRVVTSTGSPDGYVEVPLAAAAALVQLMDDLGHPEIAASVRELAALELVAP